MARLGACKTGLSPPLSIFILTVLRRYFCCGSLLFLLSVFILWVIYYVSDIFCKFYGLNEILNEHIKSSYNLPSMRNILLKFFNIIFDSGLVPTEWSIGNIIPIYKQKGNKDDPANYRPITLLSCMGKLFTYIINNRLQFFFPENHDKITQCQAGFRKGFSTTDHLYALHTLINLCQSKSKKLFCWFIDLKRAFDTVWREVLFHKLKSFDINGKCYNLIKNMYLDIKSCVTVNGERPCPEIRWPWPFPFYKHGFPRRKPFFLKTKAQWIKTDGYKYFTCYSACANRSSSGRTTGCRK